MNLGELHTLAEQFPWPQGVELGLPSLDGGHLDSYGNYIVVHEETLKAGFRLPLHPFICDFLSLIKCCPAQLDPESWRFILAFLLGFKELNMVPSYLALKSFYHIDLGSVPEFTSIDLVSRKACPGNWRSKWFLVRLTERIRFVFPKYPSDSTWRNNYTSFILKQDFNVQFKVNKFRESLTGSKTCYTDKRYPRLLEEAGLSLPHPVIVPSSRAKSITKRKKGVDARSSCKNTVSKRAKKFCTTQEDEQDEELLEDEVQEEANLEEIEEQGDEDSDKEEEEDPEEEENGCIPQEEIEEQGDEEPDEEEEEDPEEEENGCIPQGEDEESIVEEDEPASAIPCEKAASLRRLLPEIALAAQQLEAMEEQLNESRQQTLKLRREKVELECRLVQKDIEYQSRIERMELDKKAVEEELVETQLKLTGTAQKAKELFEMSSPLGM